MNKFNQKTEKPKVDIIYVRVSSDEQVQNFSLDNQEKICREFSKRDGHTILQVFREEGESAKTTDRTELQNMMRFCEQHKKQIDRIIVYNVSRMSRKTADYLGLKAFFLKLGITIVSATESFDNDPTGKFLETLLSAVAELENNNRSKNTSIGMKARALKGLWPGIAPWGYKHHTEDYNKYIYPHPEKAPIVKMMFEKYATGKYTFKEIAGMANKIGIKSMHGTKITKQLVSKITANPIYYGMIVIPKFDVSIIGSHDAIITKELFDQAQNVRTGIVGRRLPRNKDNKDFPLRGIKCGGCGKSITGGRNMGKMKNKYYYYYNCYNQECPKYGMIQKVDLENDFTKFLTELVPNDNYLEALKEAIKLAYKSEFNSVTASERRINLKISELKDKKDKLLDLRIGENISNEDFISKNESYKLQIAELEQELNSLSAPELGLDNVIDSGVEFLKHLPETWRSLDIKDFRVLRPLLFPSDLIYHYPTIKTPEVCCIYNIKPEFLDPKTHQVTSQRIEL